MYLFIENNMNMNIIEMSNELTHTRNAIMHDCILQLGLYVRVHEKRARLIL